jgi:CheY-like chemotaxis protein
LFHESFFDSEVNRQPHNTLAIRRRLLDLARSSGLKVVFFSGSKNSRTLTNNIGHIPVSVLYQNLSIFLDKARNGDENLRYLFFGENYDIEEQLLKKLIQANNQLESSIENLNKPSNSFIALTVQNDIETIFQDAKTGTFFLEEKYNNDITDEYLSEKTKEWFSEQVFDNIFIPLCFGPTLSDFNGLRFALHIRCTSIPNRLTNIFIYSFVDTLWLVKNEYFDVLKTNNITLIPYNKRAFSQAVNLKLSPLSVEKLHSEIGKIKLDPPKNYEDDHSIANDWAIYRWAFAINLADIAIDKIGNTVNNNLYFKFLKTVNPNINSPTINENKLRIEYSGSPNILYIDDEADRGWYEVFRTILNDVNNLNFFYLDEEFQNKSREEIIQLSLEKVKRENIDLVLLDFRLHPDDFKSKNIQEITGLRLLRMLKKTHPGVRVIVFSATNKVWNLLEMQKAGANAFIIKESPGMVSYETSINDTIENFSLTVEEELKYTFLKELFEQCKIIAARLSIQYTEENEEYDKFIRTLKSQVNIIKSSLSLIKITEVASIDITFLSCFNFLELFKNYYLKENKKDYRYYIGLEEELLMGYNIAYRSKKLDSSGEWLPNEKIKRPTWFNSIAALFIDYFKVSSDPHPEVIRLARISEMRNDYIHNSKEHFSIEELKLIFSSLLVATMKIKE